MDRCDHTTSPNTHTHAHTHRETESKSRSLAGEYVAVAIWCCTTAGWRGVAWRGSSSCTALLSSSALLHVPYGMYIHLYMYICTVHLQMYGTCPAAVPGAAETLLTLRERCVCGCCGVTTLTVVHGKDTADFLPTAFRTRVQRQSRVRRYLFRYAEVVILVRVPNHCEVRACVVCGPAACGAQRVRKAVR